MDRMIHSAAVDTSFAVLTPHSNLINVYEDQKEVGVRMSFSHK